LAGTCALAGACSGRDPLGRGGCGELEPPWLVARWFGAPWFVPACFGSARGPLGLLGADVPDVGRAGFDVLAPD
jgi:hypothetical protein